MLLIKNNYGSFSQIKLKKRSIIEIVYPITIQLGQLHNKYSLCFEFDRLLIKNPYALFNFVV